MHDSTLKKSSDLLSRENLAVVLMYASSAVLIAAACAKLIALYSGAIYYYESLSFFGRTALLGPFYFWLSFEEVLLAYLGFAFPHSRLVRNGFLVIWLLFTIANCLMIAFDLSACPCFAGLLSPSAMLWIDATLLTLHLGRFVRSFKSGQGVGCSAGDERVAQRVSIITGMSAATLVLATLVSMSLLRVGPVQTARIRCQQEVTVDSPDQISFALHFHNLSESPVQVIGSSSSCTCIAIEDLPVVINPGGSAVLRPTVSKSSLGRRSRGDGTIVYFLSVDGVMEHTVVHLKMPAAYLHQRNSTANVVDS